MQPEPWTMIIIFQDKTSRLKSPQQNKTKKTQTA